MNLVPFLYSKADLLESSRNIITQYSFPIFDGTDKMIEQKTLVVTLVDIVAHTHKNTYQYATPRQSLEEFFSIKDLI